MIVAKSLARHTSVVCVNGIILHVAFTRLDDRHVMKRAFSPRRSRASSRIKRLFGSDRRRRKSWLIEETSSVRYAASDEN
jgi:hypothetical protein